MAAEQRSDRPEERKRPVLVVLFLLAFVGLLAYLHLTGGEETWQPPPEPSEWEPVVPPTGPRPRRPVGPPTTVSGPATTTSVPAVTRPVAWRKPRFPERQAERDAMVEVIRAYGLTDPAVLAAMRAVPRHEFVPPAYRRQAYIDSPLPIGSGQTISQPYMVAEMTRLLKLKPTSRVLEIGTGSGYQGAVLTEFTPKVYTIEIVKPLATTAAKRLERLGYRTVEATWGDGYYGWLEQGPFDAIVVTCAAGQIPPPLVRQLAPGGRMVIPVGPPGARQRLMLVEKDAQGKARSRDLMGVRFVPFVRAGGQEND